MQNAVAFTLKELIALRHQVPHIKRGDFLKAKAMQSGCYQSRFKGRGMDFSQVRTYQAGDDIRHMDWRVTARAQKPHVKCYEEERERPVFFVIDQSTRLRFGTRGQLKSVMAARLSAVLAWFAMSQGDKVGGIVFSEENAMELRPHTQQHGVLPLLKTLVSFHEKKVLAEKGFHLSDALLRLRHVAKQRSLIFIISDFLSPMESMTDQLSYLRLHHECVLIRLTDPIERKLPFLDVYPMTDGQSNLMVNLSSRLSKREYENYFDMLTKAYLAFGKRFAVPALTVSTEDNLFVALQNILIKKGN